MRRSATFFCPNFFSKNNVNNRHSFPSFCVMFLALIVVVVVVVTDVVVVILKTY